LSLPTTFAEVSFDLYVLDFDDEEPAPAELMELMEDDANWGQPPTPALLSFIRGMEARHPWVESDPDGVPWASWPLGETMVSGRCVGFNIVWSWAESMKDDFVASCHELGLTLYDPQDDTVTRPQGKRGRRRRWWGHRSG
jgi:hypothetical protein